VVYLAQQQDDDEQQQQQSPMTSGIGPSPMTQGAFGGAPKTSSTSGAPASPMQQQTKGGPQQSAMQGRGSNFVNLSSFLSSNVAQQNQQKVQNLGGQLQTQVKDNYNKASQPLRDANWKAEDGDVNRLVDAGNYEQIGKMLTQDYAGPGGVEYDVTNDEAAKKAALLGNANTALNALSPGNYSNNLPAPTYGQGNQWLDQSLISGDRGTVGAIGGVKSGLEAFGKEAGADMDKLAAKAQGFKDNAAAAREKTSGDLKNRYDAETHSLDAIVDERRKQEETDKRMAAQGLYWNEKTKRYQPLEAGKIADMSIAESANRGNVIDNERAARLAGISKLLGVEAVQKSGDYRRATPTIKDDPNYVEPSSAPLSPEYMEKFQKAATDYYEHAKDGATGFWDGEAAGTSSRRLMESLSDMKPEQQAYAIDELERRTRDSVYKHLDGAQQEKLTAYFKALREHAAKWNKWKANKNG
jgi:hypothetical protein